MLGCEGKVPAFSKVPAADGRKRSTPEPPEGRKALGEIPTEVAWQLEYTYRSICCCTVDVKICNDLYGSSIGDNFC